MTGSERVPAATEADVMAALRSVIDPELGMSIVDLGLVSAVAVADGAVRITMTLTARSCPLHDVMLAWVRTSITALPGVEKVDVAVVFDPPWTPDRIQTKPNA